MQAPLALTIVLAVALMAGCEIYPPTQGAVVVQDPHASVSVVFSDQDRVIIRDWYDARYKSLPPGLAKKGKVPPGHAKQWARYQSLPPGRAYRSLPGDLERRLARLPDDHVRVVVDTDVMILNTRTRVILDVLYDVAYD